MASHDQHPVGSDLPRSLSEQLRILEQQLNRLSDSGPVRLIHPTRDPLDLPTVLGRPIGLAAPPRTHILGVPRRPDDEHEDRAEMGPRSTIRRHALICAVSLLLLSSTALVPSLWHVAVPEVADEELPAAVSLRTEQFAHTARELGQSRFIEQPPIETTHPAPERSSSAPITTPVPSAEADVRPVATLTVAENDLSRLSLPMLVSGGGRAWAGSAVVIDGLPTEARVSHGMKIAPDAWTVGIADVGQAVLSLPRTTPDRLELSVRVVAADSHELAASALRIHVLRNQSQPAQIAPAAIFEPAAAETGPGPELDIGPTLRQAVKVDRTKRPAPATTPVKPPPTQMAQQPDRPAAISAWVGEQRDVLPPLAITPMPKWAPFNDR